MAKHFTPDQHFKRSETASILNGRKARKNAHALGVPDSGSGVATGFSSTEFWPVTVSSVGGITTGTWSHKQASTYLYVSKYANIAKTSKTHRVL